VPAVLLCYIVYASLANVLDKLTKIALIVQTFNYSPTIKNVPSKVTIKVRFAMLKFSITRKERNRIIIIGSRNTYNLYILHIVKL